MTVPNTWSGRFLALADYLDYTSPLLARYFRAMHEQGVLRPGVTEEEFDAALRSIESIEAQTDLRALASLLVMQPDLEEKLQAELPANPEVSPSENVHRYLDISTSHLPKNVLLMVSSNGYVGLVVYQDQYGAFIVVPDDMDGVEVPNELSNLLDFAKERGCSIIRLDVDAPVEPGLPTWNW